MWWDPQSCQCYRYRYDATQKELKDDLTLCVSDRPVGRRDATQKELKDKKPVGKKYKEYRITDATQKELKVIYSLLREYIFIAFQVQLRKNWKSIVAKITHHSSLDLMQLRKNWKTMKGRRSKSKLWWCNSERIESLDFLPFSPTLERKKMQLRKNWKKTKDILAPTRGRWKGCNSERIERSWWC